MPDFLIRNLHKATVERLRARAKRAGRSLQREAKRILEDAVAMPRDELRERLAFWQDRLRERELDSSAELLKEDRSR